MKKVAIFMSHPIQYQIGLLKELNKSSNIDFHVYYFWDYGIKKTLDREFGKEIIWDIPLLDGYKSTFLKNISLNKHVSFFGCINFGVIPLIFYKKFDGVIFYGWSIFTNWLIILCCILTKTPMIFQCETPLSLEKSKSFLWRLFRKIILGLLFNKVKVFLYIGKNNKLFYKYFSVPEEKLFFTPYSVDNERYFLEQKKILQQEQAPKKRANQLNLLFIGKLISKKRPKDLIDAFLISQSLLNNKYQLILHIVGDGMLRKSLEDFVFKKSIKNIFFHGFKNQKELSLYYNEADIFILPSGYGETWGLVVNEAMCFSKPIISTNLVGCTADLVTNNNGFVYNCGDINELAMRIVDLIKNKRKRILFGKNSKKIVSQYNYKTSASSICSAINNLM
jgi:glycosyltransferase involved in cell wall biosynthesis